MHGEAAGCGCCCCDLDCFELLLTCNCAVLLLLSAPCSYPAMKGAKSDAYGGHSSHVVTTRFTPDEKFLISTGGHDLSVIQWAIQ